MTTMASNTDRVLYITESPGSTLERRENFHSESGTFHSESSTSQIHRVEETTKQISSGTNIHTKVHTWEPVMGAEDKRPFDANHNIPANYEQKYTTSISATLNPGEYSKTTTQSSQMMSSSVSGTSSEHHRQVTMNSQEPQYTYNVRRINSESAAKDMRAPEPPQRRSRPPGSVTESQTVYRDVGHASVSGHVQRRGMENGHFERKEQRVVIREGGQCTCCPYGFHVDLDFVNYCETINDGSYLKKLKRLQKEKRKLRKSMEVYLQQQESAQQQEQHVMTTVTAENKRNDYQMSSSNRVLDEIDSSVDATLASIDTMMYQSSNARLMNSDSDGTSSSASPNNSAKFNTFPCIRGKNIQEEINQFNASYEMSGRNRTDSQSSLSSISTIASERNTPLTLVPIPLHANNLNQQNNGVSSGQTTITTETTISKITHITSEQLAATMATHLPAEDGAASSQSTTTSINKSSLTAIREAMAFSLQRMRELEEQVKAIPVLQVRISVLKEEKRLLALQQKAKDSKLNMRSVGVGDDSVDTPPVSVSTPIKFDFSQNVKTPPPVMPKPKVRSKGVGDHNVLEPYLIQPDLPPSYTVRDNETYVKETLVLERVGTQSAVYSPFSKPKPLTRTIGIGDNNVFDDNAMKIHEKELRTVIIGQATAGKRNVGVDCRVATRDVGVSFSFDEQKPATRSIGVNVDTGSLLSSLSFKADEMRSALREVLHKDVHSVAVGCNFKAQTMDQGVQFSAYSVRSIGVGDSDVNIKLITPVMTKTVGCEAQPYITNKSTNTDYGWRLDAFTNTAQVLQENRSTSTEKARLWSAGTMTEDERRTVNDSSQTDVYLFMRMDQLKNVASNTKKVPVYAAACNTNLRELTSEEYDLEIKFRNRGLHAVDRGCNTSDDFKPRTYNRSCNTEKVRTYDVGVSDDRLDSFVCSFNDEEKMEETTEEVRTYFQEAAVVDGAWANRVNVYSKTKQGDVSLADDKKTHSVTEVTEEPMTTVVVQKSQRERRSNDADRTDLVEKKISGLGDAYTVTTITKKTLDDSGSRGGGGNVAITQISGSDRSTAFGLDNSRSTSDESLSQSQKAIKLGAELDLLGGSSSQTLTMSAKSGSEQSLSGDSTTSEEVIEEEETIEVRTITKTYHHGDGKSYYEKYVKDGDKQGLTHSYETIDGSKVLLPSGSASSRSSSAGSLKSCMKKSRSDGQVKRGISFAENVVGGYTSSSAAEDSSDGEHSDSDSTTSFEEGSYDSREGSIVYHCKDDEAIARGIPGAKMFDQNIRETFELNKELSESCAILSKYLEDSTEVQTKELNSSLDVIQKEWFKISSQKLSDEHQVEDYLSSFNEISRRLLEYIVNMQDSNGNTAVHYAVSHCNFEIVNLLLDTGKVDLDKQNKAGYTSTMLATLAFPQTERQHEVVQRLFSMGNVNAQASKDGQTALMLAASQGRTEIVRTLLEAGASVNAQDNEGSTAMMVACEHGYTDIVKLLLAEPDCDPSLADNDGSTPLSIAMEAGNKDIGVLLYANLNFKRQAQASPGFTRSRKASHPPSPLKSPTLR